MLKKIIGIYCNLLQKIALIIQLLNMIFNSSNGSEKKNAYIYKCLKN